MSDSFYTWLKDSGEMRHFIHEKDWSETPLGPIEEWPTQLCVAVDIMLGASEAIGIYWGSEHTLLYNDVWRELIGDKHPDALGRPAREVFPEIWNQINPAIVDVMDGGSAAKSHEQRLPFKRNGRIEDAWFDYTFNPILLGDGNVGGNFHHRVGSDRTQERQRATASHD